VKHPASARIRAVLDDLPDELDPKAEPAELVEHVDVGEVDKVRCVAIHRPGEAHLATVPVEADDPFARVDQLVLPLARPPLGPVGLAAEVGMDGSAVDPRPVVVQLEAVAEIALQGCSSGNRRCMPEKTVRVDEVKAFKTQSGNTRFVLRADDGNEYTTFKEPIAKQAIAAEGKRAKIEFHEQERNGFTNVYLDRVETLDEGAPPEAGREQAEEVAWKTAVEAAPWLLGKAPPGGVDPDEAFEKLQPFKERVAEDIREDDTD
jgi:hypothetical protein